MGSNLYLHFRECGRPPPTLIVPMLGAAWASVAGLVPAPPFLPLPLRRYMRWRMETAYGDGGELPPLKDLERFLVWGPVCGAGPGRIPVGRLFSSSWWRWGAGFYFPESRAILVERLQRR